MSVSFSKHHFIRAAATEKMEKRCRPPQGFYKNLETIVLSRARLCARKRVYDAERIIAKKINSGKPLFMIKWQGYCSSQNTWEPKAHLPSELIEAFENPDPDPVRVDEARERIGLVFERGMKVPLQYEESVEIRHLGGFGADKRASSSTYSMTRLAKMALTGDPIGQPKICLKWSPWNRKKLLSRTNCRRAMTF